VRTPRPDQSSPEPRSVQGRRAASCFDISAALAPVLGLGIAGLPFIQLIVTGDASQTDLGVSVVLLFVAIGLAR
jgi:hypothetical protein